MITVKLMGGLGNQMFQYALMRSISIINSFDFCVDTGFLEDTSSRSDFTIRSYSLNCFELKVNLKSFRDFSRFRKFYLEKICRKLLVERSFRFDPRFLSPKDGTFFIGYFQSEKYFAENRCSILKDFQFSSISFAASKLAQEIALKESVSVHVRRGDYVSNANIQKFHGVCSIQYYTDAIKYLKSLKGDLALHVYVFSDDPSWVKENLKLDLDTTYVDCNQGSDSYLDMYLMSKCKYNIIANSSFSWWGAWLNENKNKIVISPKSWFADTSIDTSDLIPSSWVRI